MKRAFAALALVAILACAGMVNAGFQYFLVPVAANTNYNYNFNGSNNGNTYTNGTEWNENYSITGGSYLTGAKSLTGGQINDTTGNEGGVDFAIYAAIPGDTNAAHQGLNALLRVGSVIRRPCTFTHAALGSSAHFCWLFHKIDESSQSSRDIH